MFNPESFYAVILPVYYTTKIFGLTPFTINSENCENSFSDLFWSIFFMLFINIYAFTSLETSGIDSEIIAKVTDVLDTYVGQGGMCCGILFGCIFRNDMLAALQDIKAFDKNMQFYLHTDLKSEYRKGTINVTIRLVAAVILAALTFSYTTYYNMDVITFELFGEFVGYTAPYLIVAFVDLQFCTLLFCLKQRFSWLNKKVVEVTEKLLCSLEACDRLLLSTARKNRLRPATHAVASGLVQDRALYYIEKIRTNHYKLCSISKVINKAYSVQILFVVLQSFITIVVSLYYSGKFVIIDNTIPVQYLIYSGVQITNAIGQLVFLVLTCSSTAAEAKLMGVLIHKIVALTGKGKNKCKEELQLEVTLFSLQLLHHNVEFTACKIFVINEPFIFSIVGAIMSYLLIVIQFEAANLLFNGGSETNL